MGRKPRATPEALRTPSALARACQVSPARLQQVASNPEAFYSSFPIPKPTGGTRIITPPVKWLRDVHRRLLEETEPLVRFPSHVCGGVKGRSIICHAGRHVGRELVVTLDIRRFYPSTTTTQVAAALQRLVPPDVARLAAAVCTYNGGLPQGSPISMFLANLVFLPADRRFHRLARRHGLAYSRYVDDLAISGDADFRRLKGPFLDIIAAHGYEAAPEKLRVRFRDRAQVVTGLVVNERLRPTRAYCSGVKQMIWNCIDHGSQLMADEVGMSIKRLKERLTGQVRFIAQFHPRLGKKLKGLLCRLWQPPE
ncbi:reverse transcriptase family protein [Planctomycetota bacterium]